MGIVVRRLRKSRVILTGVMAADTLDGVKAVGVIPARFASTRFPGKPLARETGKYLIQHVYEQAVRAGRLCEVIVATDDARIAEAVRGFGGRVYLTRADHPTGTDRIAEVAATLDADLIVNIQGDEPEMEPGNIDRLVEVMERDGDVPIATLACRFTGDADPADPNAVKVVLDHRGRAMYFSRALVPYPRDTGGKANDATQWLLHLGIYAYRREALLALAKLPPTASEQCERLEQLRFLENGYAIAVAVVERAAVGIDTPEDYAAFVARYRAAASRSNT